MRHLGATLTTVDRGADMAEGKLGPASQPLEFRDPGQTGCRPLRPLTPSRDPKVLARVLDGLHRLPDSPEPGPSRHGHHPGERGGGTSGVPGSDL